MVAEEQTLGDLGIGQALGDQADGLIFMAITMVLVRTLGLYARTTRLPAAAKVQSVAA